MRSLFSLQGPSALLPFLVFLSLFIGSGVYFTLQDTPYAFYKVSASVAILPAIFMAIFWGKRALDENIGVFLEGVRDNNIITMCMIYLLAGAFTAVLKGIGGVDATVQMALHYVPIELTLPGIFMIAAFVSTSMGTSMGTIAAVAPIALGMATPLGLDHALMAGAVVGGAMFGDNLSMISDTTIAATQIHPCSLTDKFKLNFWVALGPFLVTILLLFFITPPILHEAVVLKDASPSILLTLPYLVVLIMALAGINVFVVLSVGLMLSGLTGLFLVEDYNPATLASQIYVGYTDMTEIFLISLLIGGLSALAKDQGGISALIRWTDVLIHKVFRGKTTPKTGEAAMSVMVSFCDLCTANNTVAIILSGEATEAIAKKYKVPGVRAAAFVDIFSCVFQGILPYSAQLLLAGSIASISPVAILPHVHYCYLLGIAAVFAIVLGRKDKV